MKGLMLAKDFFRAIAAGAHTGVIKFRNEEEAFITSKEIIMNISGDKFTITVPQGKDEVIKLEYDEDWKMISQIPNSNSSDWDATSAYFDDMFYLVERIASGEKRGYFYNAAGAKFKADKTTLKLLPNFKTVRKFSIIGPKNIEMYYTVDLASDICKHGQLAALNIIDFIED
jgi:hypothetical protein